MVWLLNIKPQAGHSPLIVLDHLAILSTAGQSPSSRERLTCIVVGTRVSQRSSSMVATTTALDILVMCALMAMRPLRLPTKNGSSILVDQATIQIQALSTTIATTTMA